MHCAYRSVLGTIRTDINLVCRYGASGIHRAVRLGIPLGIDVSYHTILSLYVGMDFSKGIRLGELNILLGQTVMVSSYPANFL
ncbi:hypothetical protein GW17_00013695 [Ensete ventricosum]|nr:hypothetical protein GW17_00013695 [Ensete ventricosum]